jgi:hypothetical protein
MRLMQRRRPFLQDVVAASLNQRPQVPYKGLRVEREMRSASLRAVPVRLRNKEDGAVQGLAGLALCTGAVDKVTPSVSLGVPHFLA